MKNIYCLFYSFITSILPHHKYYIKHNFTSFIMIPSSDIISFHNIITVLNSNVLKIYKSSIVSLSINDRHESYESA